LAIVSISRIQIRRGRKNLGSGLPQLAGGELGWTVDTQELFIGNGAVSEGAPAVGNSKILTEHDNLFELSDQYTYRNSSNIQTGVSSASPIQRSLQNRLDDYVSVKSFGANGDGADQTVALQRAIDQLFLPWANSLDADNLKKRITLKIHAGLYIISDSIKLPPYVSLVGDGSDKTYIRQSGNFPVFETINGEGILAQTTSLNQSTNIHIEGMTLESYQISEGIKLYSCKDSKFIDLNIKGPWVQSQVATLSETQIGIYMEAKSTPVTTRNNTFEKISITGFSYAVLSNYDVDNNSFENATIDGCGYGVVFGKDTSLGQVGQATGPINNTISNSKFTNINGNAIWIKHGIGNVSTSNSYVLVGNDAGTDSAPVSGIIKFETNGNTSNNDFFARTNLLLANTSTLTNVAYIPEVEGVFAGNLTYSAKFNINQLATSQRIAKLPADTNKRYKIDYTARRNTADMHRSGTLNIVIDKDRGTTHIVDDYEFLGDSSLYDENSNKLNFTVGLSDENGDSIQETLIIQAINPAVHTNDPTRITFKINTLS
jgi:hypothetical protein